MPFPASEALHNLRRNRVFACRKIQGTYFEICALYFKIFSDLFLKKSRKVFPGSFMGIEMFAVFHAATGVLWYNMETSISAKH